MYHPDADPRDADHQDRGRTLAAVLLAGAAGVAGCDACGGGGPTVPFTLEGSASPSAGPAPAVAAPSASVDGEPAGDPSRLTVAGRAVPAAEGERFVQVLRGDADGDDVEDAFAWVDASSGGQLVFLAGKDRGEARAVLHGDKAQAGCRTEPRLQRLGRETVVLTLRTPCEGDAGARESLRWVVVRLPPPGDGAPEARLVVDRRDPPAGERLDIDVTVADKDGDGREDVVLHAILAGAPPPFASDVRAAADVVFLDRPAGYTLEPSEPEASLSSAAADLVRRAKLPADAEAAAAAAVPIVRLGAALCGDLGAPLVTTTAGAIRCGELRAIVDAFAAQAAAGLARRDLPRAFAAAEALRALGERASAQRKTIDGALDREAPIAPARVVSRAALAVEVTPGASSPPLAWDAEGQLLVVRGTEVSRIGPDGALENATAAPWPRAIAWSSGGQTATLTAVVRRCGPAALVATVDRGSSRIDLPLPDLTSLIPRGLAEEPCTAGRVDVGVLSLGADRTVVAVGPMIVALVGGGDGLRAERAAPPAPTDAPAPPGGARAADGKAMALLVGGDALMMGGKGPRRLRAPEIASASACAPLAGGNRLACVGARGVAVLEAETRP